MNPGRNDPCPCGSGKKYKKCCGAEGKSAPAILKQRTVAPRSAVATPENGVSKINWRKLDALRNTRGDAHAATMAAYHLDTLLDGVKVGNLDFKQVYSACMAETQTSVPPWKLIRRAQRAYNLARYFSCSLNVEGARTECGTFKGFSALMLAKFARSHDPHFMGAGFHLVDSFEGLSQPMPQDEIRADLLLPGISGRTHGAEEGFFAGSLEYVQRVMQDFPEVSYHKGWIPEVLKTLPDIAWAFVHVDVDFYQPTLACLEYFVPRLAPGGIIINDDYASPLFPGGGVGWDQFCDRHHLAFVALDTGQAVLVKDL